MKIHNKLFFISFLLITAHTLYPMRFMRRSLNSFKPYFHVTKLFKNWQTPLSQKRIFSKTCLHPQSICKNSLALLGLSSSTWMYSYLKNTQNCTTQPTPSASLWHERAHNNNPSRAQMSNLFEQDCAYYEYLNNYIPEHTTNTETVRVATYNVHFWHNAHQQRTMPEILTVISKINADILVLQEIRTCDYKKLQKIFNDLGYQYQTVCSTTKETCLFGNMTISKYPFTHKPIKKTFLEDQKHKGEQRCYIKTTIELPQHKTITLYGTHLDAWDVTEHRRTKEAEELIDQSSQDSNCIIAADCNAVRQSDYNYTINNKSIWNLLQQNHLERTKIPIPTKALALIETCFTDSFTKNNQASPKFTAWAGTTIDFLWLRNKTWQLPIVGSYVYYSAVSDHLPIIMDVKVS